jgi:hypothetical protein
MSPERGTAERQSNAYDLGVGSHRHIVKPG